MGVGGLPVSVVGSVEGVYRPAGADSSLPAKKFLHRAPTMLSAWLRPGRSPSSLRGFDLAFPRGSAGRAACPLVMLMGFVTISLTKVITIMG